MTQVKQRKEEKIQAEPWVVTEGNNREYNRNET